MPIIAMTSKTYFKHFIHDVDLKYVLDADYILASNRIKYGSKYKDQCINLFYPPSEAIMKISDEDEINMKYNSPYIESYREYLEENKKQIALIVKSAILNRDQITIIMCTDKEKHALNHLRILQQYIFDEFDYLMMMYKKGMGVYREKYSQKTLDLCNKAIEKSDKKRKKELMQTRSGRAKYYSEMPKKKLKKKLKKIGIYWKGDSKEDMINDAITYLK